MRKPKIKPLIPFIGGSSQIMLLLGLGHAVPRRLAPPVDVHVEELGADEQRDVVYCEPDQHFVACVVEGFVRGAVDVCAYDLWWERCRG